MSVSDNYKKVAERVSKIALKCGRKPEEVLILAVSKNQEERKLLEAASCGVRLFGESKVREVESKIKAVKELYPEAVFHFIGRVQTNKAKKIAEYFSLIHSVDRPEAVEAINKSAEKLNLIKNILIQLNLARETQKNGVYEEDLENLLERVSFCPNIRLKGFMLIPPLDNKEENNRKYFRSAREIFEKYSRNVPSMDVLSMGMSGDFEIAVEEGSTLVRVGTLIFGSR